jgi:hypothetical protein
MSLLAQPCTTPGPACIPTGQNDNARDAYNPTETVLTSPNLKGGTTITELAPLLVDSPPATIGASNPIYTQPLYIAGISLNANAPAQSLANCSNLTVNGQPGCNMLLVATLYSSLWAYNADTGQVIFSRLGLWNDCGPGGTVAVNGQGGVGALPFAGVISTPVVDTTLSPPAMFLTDICLDSQAKTHWFLHEVDITNQFQDVTGSGSPLEIAGSNGGAKFVPGTVMQRPALLEVQNPGGSPANAIYIAFGAAVPEAGSNPYHGWLFGYSTSGPNNQLVQDFVFNTTGPANQSATPGCNAKATICTGSNCKPGQFENQPNWCGHGGGIWLSGRGPAASTTGGVTRAFVGVGNGGFQSGAANWGDSILDFTSSAAGVMGAPSDSFTPRGGPNSPFSAAILADSDCPTTVGGSPVPCKYTVENLNENDMDMAVGGVMLFSDANADNWLLTADKLGAGYLLNQDNMQGFTQNDPGNHFPFLTTASPCWTLGVESAACHRVTSFASFEDSTGIRRIYYWPMAELLNGVRFSNNSPVTGIGTIATAGAGPPYTSVSLSSACTLNSATAPCLNNQFVAGDTLTAGSQPQTVTGVSQTLLTVTPGFNSPLSTASWTYNGYLISPVYGNDPSKGTAVNFPGGQLEVTANNGSGGIVWGLATLETASPGGQQECATNTATLIAFDAVTLREIWSSFNSKAGSTLGPCNGPCFSIMPPSPPNSCRPGASTYGLPDIANGSIYIPTYNITGTNANPDCTASTPCSGLIVYCGSGATSCNGQWQAANP